MTSWTEHWQMDRGRRGDVRALGFLVVGLVMLLGGCAGRVPGVAAGPSTGRLAHIESDVPILSTGEGELSSPVFAARLEPGARVVTVAYPTLLATYRCTFEIVLDAGESYEIVERADRFPVFLYRIRTGRLFWRRLDRQAPADCVKIEGDDESSRGRARPAMSEVAPG